jgi:RND family efflux transporter MFP subunit
MTALTRPSTWLGASATLTCSLLVSVVLALAACTKSAPEDVESETVVPVTTAMAEVGRITAGIHASGLVTPAPGAELIVVAPETARVAEIPKGEGETVHRGDLLVRFEIPSSVAEVSKQRAEISRAEARLTAAQASDTRMRDLFDRGVAARKEVEAAAHEVADAQADLAGARAATTAAETVAARSTVRATFDGIVSKRQHNPGDLVEPAAADFVVRVVDPRRLEVAVQVSLNDAPRVRIGAPARIAAAEGDAPTAALTVASRPTAVQEGTATVPVRLAFKRPANYPVAMPVQIEIDAETHDRVVLVPTAAVVHEGEEAAVFVLMGDKAQRRAVKVGLVDEQHAEIVSGVKSGETVITSNQNGLPDGAKVTVSKPAAEDAADAAPKDGK